MIVEICVQSKSSALMAQQFGADRIELCSALELGGLTPSSGLIQSVISEIQLPVHVLIRPRLGDFCYDKEEINAMRLDVIHALKLGAQGVVIGALTQDFDLDIPVLQTLIQAAKDQNSRAHITAHRAFDWTREPMQSLTQLQEMGVDTLLSSGQAARAEDGLVLLKKMHQSSHESFTIMPGAGINATNRALFEQAGFKAIHASASRLIQDKHPGTGVAFEEALSPGQRRELDPQKLKDFLQQSP